VCVCVCVCVYVYIYATHNTCTFQLTVGGLGWDVAAFVAYIHTSLSSNERQIASPKHVEV
jgi:hypothetical protein